MWTPFQGAADDMYQRVEAFELTDRRRLARQLEELLAQDLGALGVGRWRGPAKALSPAARRAALALLAERWAEGLDLAPSALDALVASGLDPLAAEDLLAFFERRGLIGVCADDPATGQPRLGFGHDAIAAHLVADALHHRADAGACVLQHVEDDRWEEIASIWVATVDAPEQVGALIEALVDHARGADGSAGARVGALAAECVEAAGAPPALSGLLDPLQAIFADPRRAAPMPARARARFWRAVASSDRRLTPERRWVHAPAGRYWLGAAPGDTRALASEAPVGAVELGPFCIQRWPVTVSEYRAFVEAGGYRDAGLWRPDAPAAVRDAGAPDGWAAQVHPSAPVTGVSWWEAWAYCAWLSRPERRPPGIARVRLPTEPEWEAAARGPLEAGPRLYPWGDDPEPRASSHDRARGLLPVGVFPDGASPLGVWDLAANGYEWTADPWTPRPTAAPEAASATPRMVAMRSGVYLSEWGLRISTRTEAPPGGRGPTATFRCAATLI